MGLPKLDQPIFTCELPSTSEKIKYRPFTVKEEKILLIAQESKDPDQIIDSIKQIITNCVLNKKDVNEYPMFDIEYLIMNIRAKSVNNVVKFNITDPEFDKQVELEFNIDNLTLSKADGHTNEISSGDNVKIIMKYPSIDQLREMIGALQNKATDADMLNVMLQCIDTIVVGEDEVHKLSDYSEEDVIDFLEGMSTVTVNQIKNFFETMPRLRHECPYTIEGKEKTFVIEGMETFFI